jgi:midasin (ATPase involved in ribosome maturation)
VQGKGKFAFGFVEGPLVKALRSGDWYVELYAHICTRKFIHGLKDLAR